MADFDMPMLSNFIHQVINPLNGVVGTIDNLIDGTTRPEKREQRLRAVKRQLEHSIELIRNLAYLASISGDTVDTQMNADVIVPQTVIEAMLFYQEPGYTRGIRIELPDKDTQYVVKGNPHLLRQVFLNIFENGVKYGDPNTRISVTANTRPTGELIMHIDGRGLPIHGADRERIFELGYRTTDAKAQLSSGTGLGLYICRRIMEQTFNGKIWADHNHQTRNTTFHLKFPAYRIDGKKAPKYQP